MGLFDLFKKKNTTSEPQSQPTFSPNEQQMQFVSLFYENQPSVSKEDIWAELNKRFSTVKSSENEKSLSFYFPEYTVNFEEGEVPAQGNIMISEGAINFERFISALRQAWDWEEAEESLKKSTVEINLFDFMSRGLNYQKRLEYFQKFVLSVVNATQPTAIYFRNSDKLINPVAFLDLCEGEQGAFLYGSMNVRMYNVSDGDGGFLMDTVGLHAFGLPDFECRFKNYQPNDIAQVLHNIAYYTFDAGDIFRSNSTVQGIGENPVWKTNRTEAKVKPERMLIELIPN